MNSFERVVAKFFLNNWPEDWSFEVLFDYLEGFLSPLTEFASVEVFEPFSDVSGDLLAGWMGDFLVVLEASFVDREDFKDLEGDLRLAMLRAFSAREEVARLEEKLMAEQALTRSLLDELSRG